MPSKESGTPKKIQNSGIAEAYGLANVVGRPDCCCRNRYGTLTKQHYVEFTCRAKPFSLLSRKDVETEYRDMLQIHRGFSSKQAGLTEVMSFVAASPIVHAQDPQRGIFFLLNKICRGLPYEEIASAFLKLQDSNTYIN